MNPAGGDAGSADAPRELLKPSLPHQPDEARATYGVDDRRVSRVDRMTFPVIGLAFGCAVATMPKRPASSTDDETPALTRGVLLAAMAPCG